MLDGIVDEAGMHKRVDVLGFSATLSCTIPARPAAYMGYAGDNALIFVRRVLSHVICSSDIGRFSFLENLAYQAELFGRRLLVNVGHSIFG